MAERDGQGSESSSDDKATPNLSYSWRRRNDEKKKVQDVTENALN